MPLWDKVKQELDRAGRAAQGALDEGKLRLDEMRARQLADKAAQALGYAVHRARQAGQELDAETYAGLSGTLAGREAEADRFATQLQEAARRRKAPAADESARPAPEPAPPEPLGADPPAPDAAGPTTS